MDTTAYKRHLLNHMSYSHAYFLESGKQDSEANRVALCEAASHAMGCAWVLSDYHRELECPDMVAADAWEGLANRWIQAVGRWSKGLPSNRAAAYAAPVRERKALTQWPSDAASTGTATTTATTLPDATPTPVPATAELPIGGGLPATSNTAASGADRQGSTPRDTGYARRVSGARRRYSGHDAG